MFMFDDKIRSIKRCELSAFIITVYGSYYFGGCTYSFECLVRVIPMLVFLARGYDENSHL
jgi:hypothetical protein